MRLVGIVLAAWVAGAVLGCGSDTACDEAADKLENECDLPEGSVSVTGDCDSTSECEANCINEHSCDQIMEAFGGTPNAYSECDDACS